MRPGKLPPCLIHEKAIPYFAYDRCNSPHTLAHNPTRGQCRIQPGVDHFRKFSRYAHSERCGMRPAVVYEAFPATWLCLLIVKGARSMQRTKETSQPIAHPRGAGLVQVEHLCRTISTHAQKTVLLDDITFTVPA